MFGNKLKSLRSNLGKTQEEIAKSLGLSRAAYSHFENGRNEPDYETLKKISEYFHVSTDYLLGRTDDPLPVRDVDQDLHAEHNYTKELEDFLRDNVTTAMFQDYGDWTEEEKRDLLQFLKGQKALREQNKEK
ncbi:MAG: transcriptional regulator [Firmicutes bacterium HGW-Firmicutes-4]|jgi:transcriptional regulator with XRE-family HTH domain|nr:MAG: transcriptional regulator [Firmicutes bacterium HGW-Firmicutes-4]